MDSIASPYQLQTFPRIMSHGWQTPNFLRDQEDVQQLPVDLDLEAKVRSGDYFITLATTLDSIGRDVNEYLVRDNIEDIVSDLINLQDNYSIVKK